MEIPKTIPVKTPVTGDIGTPSFANAITTTKTKKIVYTTLDKNCDTVLP